MVPHEAHDGVYSQRQESQLPHELAGEELFGQLAYLQLYEDQGRPTLQHLVELDNKAVGWGEFLN